jgi:hypothetical protein
VQLIVGDDPDRCLGYDIERAADLTGDDRDDLLVSDPCTDQVWVLSGVEVAAATGPGISPAARVLESTAAAVEFGVGVHGRADLTGDGSPTSRCRPPTRISPTQTATSTLSA